MVKILSIDPGKSKCGIAILDEERNVLEKKIIFTENFDNEIKKIIKLYQPEKIILGNKTYSKEILKKLKNLMLDVILVDEHLSSLKARKLYFKENPPRGIWRFIPESLRYPKVPIDEYVAVVLAEEYLKI